jgi:Polysaccharide biosynthesis enzyme WcbI
VTEARRRHYGTFYGSTPLPHDGRPVIVVLGNCQAESVRVLLAGPSDRVDGGSSLGPGHTVRIPPVHELTASDLPFLEALLARTDVLLSQPVRAGYRDLPIGTDDCVARLPAGARTLRFPIIRHLGWHPYQAIVRDPENPHSEPPLVPYHDLRLLAAARDGRTEAETVAAAHAVDASAEALRAVGRESIAELARRETRCDVAISDLLAASEPPHTVNHPGNDLLIALARRIQSALGLPETAEEPGRALLGGVRAPLEGKVLAALGLLAAPRDHWLRDGHEISIEDVARAHLAWYARHPGFVRAGLTRHADRMVLLGL